MAKKRYMAGSILSLYGKNKNRIYFIKRPVLMNKCIKISLYGVSFTSLNKDNNLFIYVSTHNFNTMFRFEGNSYKFITIFLIKEFRIVAVNIYLIIRK